MPRHLADIVTCLAATEPEREIWHLLFADRATQTITASQLHRNARQIAARLEEQGVSPGNILPLVFSHSYELLAAFWGAIYLGAVPTILPYLSADTRSNAYLDQLRRLISFVHAGAILTSEESQSYLEQGLQVAGCRILTLAPLTNDPSLEGDTRFPNRTGSNLPYIQFSSGTTGLPKGVMLTHDALLHYMEISKQTQAATRKDVTVGWLPLYHDMGLVNQVLNPLYGGYPSVMMSPTDWLGQPQRLFEAIHQYRGSITWMPNFAFRYCTRRIRDEQLAGLDLSSWRVLGNGAEPVRLEDLEAFAKRFAPYGLRRSALTIGYGLAEHVAGLSWTPHDCAPEVDWVSEKALGERIARPMEPHAPGARPIVSCGYPMSTVTVRVVNDAGQDVADREVGQVLVQSPCLFTGYYLLPEESARVMKEGWLNTEDLGYLANGQLYICGRKKDLMIIGGRNIHPTQLETIVETLLGKRCRFAAAFGIPNPELGTEMPVVVCEMREPVDDATRTLLQSKIREQVQEALQLFVSDVYLVEPGWILKTTSGKINRKANRDKYLAEVKQSDQSAALPEETANETAHPLSTDDRLARIWQRLFKQTTIHADDNFFQLGGDSLLAVQLMMEIEQEFGCTLSEGILVQAPTISTLAAMLDRREHPAPGQAPVPLQHITAESNHPVFFCVHGLGGGLLVYKELVNALGPAQPIYGLQPPARDGMLHPYSTMHEMAARYIDAIKQVQPHGPYYLGGHSFGGVVAFEIARQLNRVGEPVALVAIFDSAPPLENVKRDGIARELRFAFHFARNVPYWLRDYVRTGRFKMRGNNRRVLGLARKRLLQLTGRQVELEAQDVVTDISSLPPRHLKVVETHMAALHQYLPTPYHGRLVLFRTKFHSLQSPERDMGWQRLATEPIDIHLVGGTHRTMMNESNVRELAAKLRGYLDESSS